MRFNPNDLIAIAPEITLTVFTLLVIVIDLFFAKRNAMLQTIVIIGVILAGVATIYVSPFLNPTVGAFNGMIAADGMSTFIKILLLGVVLLTVLMSKHYFNNSSILHSDYYALLLMSSVGMMFLATSTDLISFFVGLETMSIALYVLAGLQSDRPRSNEAGLKYLLLGAFSSAFLLYGIALVYGATRGATNFADIINFIQMNSHEGVFTMLNAGIGLILVGFLFKVAAVPFHFWSPDTYQGAPTPVTAFMSAGPKAAALIAFLRVFGWGFGDLSDNWVPILSIVAILTMVLGNLIALVQTNIKRLLAYSSVSHVGYLLIGIIAASNVNVRTEASAGLMFYLVAYYLMNMGAFTIAILISRSQKDGDYHIDDYQGLASKHPALAAAMAIFMISLAGIPPTAGFFGKFYLFSAAVKADLIVLVVIGVLASVVSAYYYLRIVVFMYMRPAVDTYKVARSGTITLVLIICVLGVLKLGFFPSFAMKMAKDAGNNVHNPSPNVVSISQ